MSPCESSQPASPPPIVAIDGPAGAGKSTLARSLAHALGVPYVNTGLMYRALAAAAHRDGIDAADAEGLAERARKLRFELDDSDPPELRVDGRGPAEDLTEADVEAMVSQVSSHPSVRSIMREAQRSLGRRGGVLEGRDIATVVFPEADLKVFLTASPEARAARRALERGDRPVASVARRDALDARTNPLQPAPGAVVIDATNLSAEDVLRLALDALGWVRPRLAPGRREGG
jgi:CMP/dCMP kinase